MTHDSDHSSSSLAALGARLCAAVAEEDYQTAERLLIEQRLKFEEYCASAGPLSARVKKMALVSELSLELAMQALRAQGVGDLEASKFEYSSRVVVHRHSYEMRS